MLPTITLFGKTIGTYVIMALIGGLLAGVYACRAAAKRGQDDNDIIVVLLFAALGCLLGGHLLYALTNLPAVYQIFFAESFTDFLRRAVTGFGGSVFYGGLFGGIAAAALTMHIKRMNIALCADILTPAIPLFHAFARVGCFLGGCCYGIESPLGFAAHGNPLVPAVNDVSRFPVQLLEAVLNAVLFLVLLRLYSQSRQKPALQGKLLLIYLPCYAVMRFFIEFLRGDEIRGFVGGLSTSQFISLLLLVTVAVVWLLGRRSAPRTSA
ncbi:MAG: prolipoprotein diacylglyceryl transferase [Clostridia bacterium]|nr:prolipoprotein diacylglyceryl transferase [Clostridia bacterium]MBQ8718193.1 prolipoprotein diacylglyceryl transferase [Clostridia bacterium]